MSFIFYECPSLAFLPDISKWKTKKYAKINSLFVECITLSFFPDVSEWCSSKIFKNNKIGSGCLNSLHELKKKTYGYLYG